MLALAAILLLPSAVQGEEDQTATITGFHLQASNGYELLVLAIASPEGEQSIALFLTKNDGGFSAVSYAAPATVTSTTIEADLGKLGRISVALVPTGRTKTVRLSCRPGKTWRVEEERYEGTIEFHGEEGFTDVTAGGAPFNLNPCGLGGLGDEGGRSPGKTMPGARLHAEKRRIDDYRFELDAIQKRPGAKTAVGAEVEEHRGEMEIHRAVGTWASADALHYDRRLRTATIRPPDPFSGHASFRFSARSKTTSACTITRTAACWTGNLTVDFPGRSDVPLTGPGFSALLEHPTR